MNRKLTFALGAAALLIAAVFSFWPGSESEPMNGPLVTGETSPAVKPSNAAGPFSPPAAIDGAIEITVPDALGGLAALGAGAFEKNCSECHGKNAAGSENGPPLVHITYEPGHHGDGAFFLAAQQGVRAHHWRFGDMPKQENVTETQVKAIVAYIRALQVANGIH